MDSIKIEDYLQNRQPNKTGTCKQCGKQIPWNRQKLGNHKRSGNCLGQSKQEQNMFKSLNTNSTIFIGNQPESTFTESNPKRHKPNWIDSTTEEQKKHYDQKCARFIFENCLPFSVVESPSFKDFVKSIRPSYNPPTRKKVAGPLLLDEFSQKEADIEDPLTWWSIYGKEEFPNLSKIAIRVQQVPTSSAASERAWSIFARIHNKIRNRLMNERVHQLAYVCINKQLRSNYDVNNDNFDF